MAEKTRTYDYRFYFGVSVEDSSTDIGTLALTPSKTEFKIDNRKFTHCVNGVKFTRKLYEPGLIEAEVAIEASDTILPSMSEISALYLNRLVKLTIQTKDIQGEKEITIAENYYVYEVCPQIVKNNGVASLFVKLVINSIDKLMTLEKYSKVYISKKLGSGILMPESRTFGFNGSSLIKTNVDSLKFLRYDSALVFKDPTSNEDIVATIPSEFIQPYLVQYNESFYDFMVRTSNRCGEFLFFEDGELFMGLPETEAIKTITFYESITQANYANNPLNVETFYRDSAKDGDGEVQILNFETSSVNSSGFPSEIFPDKPPYNAEVANDEFLYPLIPDKWTNFDYEMGFDPEYGSGKAWKGFGTALVLSVISNELKNTKTNWISNAIDFAINLAAEWGAASAKCFWFINLHPMGTIDSLKNKRFIEDQKTNYSEQSDGNRFVGFGTKDTKGWVKIDFYKDIFQREQKQQKQIIRIDMGVNFIPVKLGEMIKLEGFDETYVVIKVDMVSDTKWTRDYKMYNDTTSDIYSGKQSMVIYAIPTYKDGDGKETAVPPVSAPFFRKAGPQTAYVIDNDDPKYQGRVRIAYPWQSAKEQLKLALEEAEISLAKVDQEVDMLDQVQQEILDTLAQIKGKKSIFAEFETLNDEERKARIEELEKKQAEDEALIEKLSLPDDGNLDKTLTFADITERFTRQSELKRVQKEYDILTAVLNILKSSEEDLATNKAALNVIIDSLETDLANKLQELADLRKKTKEVKEKKELNKTELQNKVDAWTQELIQISSPWVRVATPAASNGGGTYFKPQKGDEVLVNYDNNNIERPYVVGSLFSKNLQTPEQRLNITTAKDDLLKDASTYIMSPNGHHIVFNDPADGTKLMAGIQGALTQVVSMAGCKFEGMKDMTGGIHMGDRFGFYELSMSSHSRKVKLSSPFGNVEIDAFSGISLNAPNGDIKISGKNVEISAGNNITIKSGENIQKPVFGHPTVKGKLGGIASGIVFGVIGGVADAVVGPYLDMTFIRHFVEVILRPIEGTMQIRSNRYMKLEAGIDSFAQIPAARYEGDKKRNLKARGEIPFLSKTVDCIKYMDTTVNNFVRTYIALWNLGCDYRQTYQDILLDFLNEDNETDYVTICLDACTKGWQATLVGNMPDVVTADDFNNKIKAGDIVVNGTTYNTEEAKKNKLVQTGNQLAQVVNDIHRHMESFEKLFDHPVVPGADDKMKELLKKAYNDRKGLRFSEWGTTYLNNQETKNVFLESKIEKESKDPIAGAAKRFKRTVAAVFLAELANCDDYKMDPINAGGGIKAAAAKANTGGLTGAIKGALGAIGETGNVVGRFLRDPLLGAKDGKYLKLMYKASDVKEERMESEFHWHHFVDKMQKPKNAAARKLYDSTVGKFAARLQIDEFARIHDREVWADRGYGTILMSDKFGETRVFNSGAFTKEEEASKGNWNALVLTLKSIN